MTTSDCRWCGDTGTVPGPDVPCPRCSPQSQGVPTGEVDIDLAVSRFLGRYGEPHRPWEEKDLVALLSERERLAYDMGRSQAAGEDPNRLSEARQLLARLVKYVREDRAETPGKTRLARLTDQVDDYLRRTHDPKSILRAASDSGKSE